MSGNNKVFFSVSADNSAEAKSADSSAVQKTIVLSEGSDIDSNIGSVIAESINMCGSEWLDEYVIEAANIATPIVSTTGENVTPSGDGFLLNLSEIPAESVTSSSADDWLRKLVEEACPLGEVTDINDVYHEPEVLLFECFAEPVRDTAESAAAPASITVEQVTPEPFHVPAGDVNAYNYFTPVSSQVPEVLLPECFVEPANDSVEPVAAPASITAEELAAEPLHIPANDAYSYAATLSSVPEIPAQNTTSFEPAEANASDAINDGSLEGLLEQYLSTPVTADNAAIPDLDAEVLLDLIPVPTEDTEPEIIFEGRTTTEQEVQEAVRHAYQQPGLTISVIKECQKRRLSEDKENDDGTGKKRKTDPLFLSKKWPNVYLKSEHFSHNFNIMARIAKAGQDAAAALQGLESFLAAKKGRPTHQHLNSMSRAIGVVKALGPILDQSTLTLSDQDFFKIISRKRVYEIYEGRMNRTEVHFLVFKLICIQARITAYIQRMTPAMTTKALEENVLNAAWRYKAFLLTNTMILPDKRDSKLAQIARFPYNDEAFSLLLGKTFNDLVSAEDRAELFRKRTYYPPPQKN